MGRKTTILSMIDLICYTKSLPVDDRRSACGADILGLPLVINIHKLVALVDYAE